VVLGVASALVTVPAGTVAAASPSQDFEGMTLGSVNGQQGWSVTGSAFDYAIADTTGLYAGALGTRALRVSNAVTSGSFGDQLFSEQLPNEAGETSAENAGLSGGVRQHRYSTSFTFASADPTHEQPGLVMGISPDRGDGARMSLVRLYDTPTGLKVTAFGYNTDDSAFPETPVASNLDRTQVHTFSLTMDLVDGTSNDRVAISVDGSAPVVIGSWEQYFRDSEGNPTRTVDSLLFRASIAAPDPSAILGKGFYIDSVGQSSGGTPVPTTTSRTISPGDIAGGVGGWQGFREADWPSSATSQFVAGPAGSTGASSMKVSLGPVTGANNGKYTLGRLLPGVPLGDITGFSYRVLTDPANNGVMQPYVNIPISGGGVTYANLVYDPNDAMSNPDPLPSSNGVWRTFDPFAPTARWRATRVVAGKPTWTFRTLTEWIQLAPDLTTHPTVGGVYVISGASQVYAPWTNYVAYLDRVSLTVAGATTVDTFAGGSPLSPTTVVASDLRPRSATLTWAPDPGTAFAPVDAYEVVVDGTPQTVAATVTTLDLSPLTPGSAHRVSVRAIRGSESGPAVETSFVTPVVPVPDAVSGLVAGSITRSSAALTWNADPTVGTGAVDSYEVSVSPTGSVDVVPASSLSRALTNLAPGSTYTVVLRAHNESGWSNPTSVTFTTSDLDRRTPGAPTLSVGTPDAAGAVALSWTANAGDSADFPVQHWVVTVDGADEAYLPAATTNYTVTALALGRHVVSVRGVNALGGNAFSAQVVELSAPSPAPGAPVSTLSASPEVITSGSAVVLHATFRTGSTLAANATVVLARRSGSTWVTVATATTSATGAASFTVKPSVTTRYRVVSAGMPSAETTLSVRPKISVTVRTSTSAGVTLVTLTASVAPRLGGAVVRLQRLIRATWTTVASHRLGRASGYAFTLRTISTLKGVYRVQVPATATTVAGASARIFVTVVRH
jgi:hypothetical protein